MNKKQIIFFLLIVCSLYFLGMMGYCHSWWGKNSLVMRSFWLCSCGPEFEQSLYPDHAEVVFSACDNVNMMPVAKADGSLLLVYGDNNFSESDYFLWQPLANEKIPFFPPESSYEILNDEYLLVHGQHNIAPPKIINFRSGESAPISVYDPEMLPDIYLSNGVVNPNVVSLLFDNSSQLFAELVYGRNTLIVLGSNWKERPEENFVLSEVYLPQEKEGWLKDVIDASGKSYSPLFWGGANERNLWYSPNGRFYADKLGIHTLPENELILSMAEANHMTPCPEDDCTIGYVPVGFHPCCWLPDSSAVLYEFKSGGLVLFETIGLPSIFWGAPIKFLTPSMPVLKVAVPEE